MKLKLIQWLAARLPRHPDGDLHNPDAPYMLRRIILDWPWLHIRLHHLAGPDADRELHDHPAAFVSLVLHGGYAEERPITVAPCFHPLAQEERVTYTWRTPGSLAFRHAAERHRISAVAPDTWTLFVFIGRRHQWWGYYTPRGKVYCKDYFDTLSDKRAS